MPMRWKWWLSLAIVLVTVSAQADWPMNRHDGRRSAEGSGTSQLARPAVAWRYYLGGAVNQLVPLDVDGDGIPEVLYVSGGILFAKRSDDSIVWQTPVLGLLTLAGVSDVNGDGEQDIVAVGTPGLVAVFRAHDGAMEWRDLPAQFGSTVGAVRLADLNGDGLKDIYAADAGCAAQRPLGDVAHAFTFGAGFGTGTSDATTHLWQLEQGRDYVCGEADVVADLNGDGHPEIVAFSSTLAWVFDGRTGQKLQSGDASAFQGYALGFSVPYGVLTALPTDLDGTGHMVIVGYTNNPYPPTINSRSVFVMSWDPTRPTNQRFFVRWRHDVANLSTDTHAFVDNGAMDLDGDGRMEVTSTFITGGVATTSVYRGSDGMTLAQMQGTLAGLYRLGAGQPATVVVSLGGDLHGYQFPSLPSPAPAPVWTIPSALPIPVFDVVTGTRGQATIPEPIGSAGIVVRTTSGHLQLWNVTGTPSIVGDVDMSGLNVSAAVSEQNIDQPGPGLLVARSDGIVLVLDATLQVLNMGSATVALTGIRTGGFYANSCIALDAPVAARVDRTVDSVFATDSRGMLVRLDPTGASVVQPPRVEWSWARARTPLLADLNGDHMPDLVAQVQDPDVDGTPGLSRTLEARFNGGAATSWSQVVATMPRENFQWDVAPLMGPGATVRLTVSAIDQGSGNGRVYGVGADGTALFATTPLGTVGGGQGVIAALDANHDGVDDALIDLNGQMRLYSGVDGSLLGHADAQAFAEVPLVLPRVGVPAIDVIAPSSVYGLQGFQVTPSPAVALMSRWQRDGLFANAYCGGASVTCADGVRFAAVRRSTNVLTVVDAATGAMRYEVSLARGVIGTASDGGLLADVITSPSLDGTHPAFLTGSNDGFLYAVDACASTPTLRWAFNLQTAVGNAILSDTDGDGLDEILVEAADGYLYAIDTEVFPAPAWVRDVDPPHGLPDTEVSTICGDSVFAHWADVPNALGYEWALFTVRGTPVSHAPNDPTNPFIRVDPTVHTAAWSDGLVVGSRYVFAVHAIGPDGNSTDTVSPGVRFTGPCPGTPDGGGPDASTCTSLACHPELQIEGRAGPWGRCVCTVSTFVPSRAPARGWAWVLGGVFAARRPRRRRRAA